MAQKYTIKQILLSNQNWWHFYEKNKTRIRPDIVTCITKLLSCKNTIRGYREYHCANPNCSHVKRVPFTCKCKACSSCGKKLPNSGYKNKIKYCRIPPGNTLPSPCHASFGTSFGIIVSYLH